MSHFLKKLCTVVDSINTLNEMTQKTANKQRSLSRSPPKAAQALSPTKSIVIYSPTGLARNHPMTPAIMLKYA